MLRGIIICLVSTIFVAHLLSGVSSIRCYSCLISSPTVNDSDCQDPMNSSNVSTVDCPSETTYCMRISYYTGGSETYGLQRDCDRSALFGDQFCEINYAAFIQEYPNMTNYNCYLCAEDNCNDH